VFTLQGETYRVCCDCGAKFAYSLETMSTERGLPLTSALSRFRIAWDGKRAEHEHTQSEWERRALRKMITMSWFHSSTAAVDARDYASPAEIVACFQDQRNVLGGLALLVTGDQAMADQAVVQACEITLQGNSPFRDWLLEWAKGATIAPRWLAMAQDIKRKPSKTMARFYRHVSV
jgi:hypothetical protein